MTEVHLTTVCRLPNHISYDQKPEYRKGAVLEAHKKNEKSTQDFSHKNQKVKKK